MRRLTIYSRVVHAAHYSSRGGHDLERWDVTSVEPTRTDTLVPDDAECSHGYLTSDGVQHWVFQRRAPLSDHPECATCRGLTTSPLWLENDRALKQLTVDLAAIDAEMTRRGL